MKVGNTDFSEEAVKELKGMTLTEARESYPSVHIEVLKLMCKKGKEKATKEGSD